MNNYTIYCTLEQAKKALKLGAPIDHKEITTKYRREVPFDDKSILLYHKEIICPTADQMINWLEEQGIIIIFMATMKEDLSGYTWIAHICHFEDKSVWVDAKGLSRKEATISAIDAALEYLEKIRKD